VKLKSLKLVPLGICAGAIGLACLAQGLLGYFGGLQLFQRLEWITYDWRLRVANNYNPPVSDKLGFVFIDDDTIRLVKSGELNTNFAFGLQWPRHIYGQVVRELKAQGAKAVGLDIFFDELRPDHRPVLTPRGLARPDDLFAQSLKEAGNVVIGATKELTPAALFRTNAAALGDLSHERDSDGVLRRDRVFHDYRLWHRTIALEAALAGWDLANAVVHSNQIVFPKAKGGHVFLPINNDGYFDPSEVTGAKPAGGVVRLAKAFEKLRVWHLGIVLAAQDLGLDLDKALVELDKGRITLTGSNGLKRIIPVDRHGQFLIDWSLGLNDSRLTSEAFESVLSQSLRRPLGTNIPARFEGKLVVIGSTAAGNDLTDRGATPLAKDSFLTSDYWNVVSSILTGRFIQQSSLLTNLAIIFALGLGAGFASWRLPALWASLVVAVLVVLCVLLALFVFVRYRWLFPIVMPVGAALMTHFGLLIYQTFFEQNERRRIKTLFVKLVSPNIVDELLKTNTVSLVGARGQVTVFFADIRGFTEMTDRSHAQAEEYVREQNLGSAEAKLYFDQQAQVLLHTVNLYLGLIADVNKKHEGTLDKYLGDCVMAFWGAPIQNARHALACVRAAIDAQRAIDGLNHQRAAQNKIRQGENLRRTAKGLRPVGLLDLLSLGTGINTGDVTVGVMGSDAHGLNYTVFGRDVNLASRLEGHSGRGRIIISESTYLGLRKQAPTLASTCIPLPRPTLKGFGTAVTIYEVPWKPNATAPVELLSSTTLLTTIPKD